MTSIAPAPRTSALADPDEEPLLRVEGLRTHFFTNDGVVRAVDGVDLTIHRGETLGVVGESGCGKSITALSIMQLLAKPGRTVAGRIVFEGRNLLELPADEVAALRGNDISMIFQEPMTSLNPVFRVGDQIAESIQKHMGWDEAAAKLRCIELFELVGIPSPDRRVDDYPHQLSGGLRQRVMIAMALANRPKLLIADEPTTALDVTIQAQILELIKRLKDFEDMSVMMITHDLGVIAEMAQSVVVMYAGKIVEAAPVIELFQQPQHPYTQGLLASIPTPEKIGHRLDVIKGVVPHPLNLPPGCTFAPRCPKKFEPCDSAFPALDSTGPEHRVACYLYTDKQDEVRESAHVSVDPNSPIAEQVLEAAATVEAGSAVAEDAQA
jgi:oligopeptide/dipeptide ABC transporter ATP-binding protein